LVELHNGTVVAHSTGPGGGSTFTVLIPRLEAVPESAASQPALAELSQGNRRILIVEDNADAREALREALEQAGHQIFEATSGSSGVESALAHHPDVALIDIGLPGIDGYEVARRIRSASEARGMMLVALTGYGSPEDRRRSAQAGFDAHLVKPLNFDQLADLLTTLNEPALQ
jgi:CheY-like chemotaxis protein